MFGKRKRRRELKQKIDLIRDEQLALGPATLANINDPERRKLGDRVQLLTQELERFESDLLTSKAEHLGIDIPRRRDWWESDAPEGSLSPQEVTYWLSTKGRLGLSNLIKQETRKELDWWLKVIAALTGLGGVLIGIISALKR